MFKRILSFTLSAVLLLGTLCVPVAAAELSVDTVVTEQEGLIRALGIISASDVDKSVNVTRAQFAEYLWSALKHDDLKNPEALFADVPADSYITDLAHYGYFVGDGGAFEPAREMTINEAYIVATRVTGYDVLANLEGGTPLAYSKVAMRAGLTSNVSEGDGFTFKNAIIILYNILTVPLYEVKSISDEGIRYSDNKGNTLLEITYGIKIAAGVVTANSYTSIYQNIYKTDENSIRIEQDVFECSLMNADKLLGRYVTAYYNAESGNKEIIYVYTDDEKDGIIEIDARDFKSFAGNSISYYYNERVKNVSLEDDAVFIHNGMLMINPVGEEKLEALKMDYGKILLYKSGKASYYTVIITEFKTAVVTSVDEKNEIVYAENLDGTAVKFSKEEKDFLYIYTANGNTELELSALGQGALVSYALSSDGKVAEIFLCSGSVTGAVSMISDADGEKVLTLNGNRYTANKDFAAVADLKIGISTTYLLDIFGNIAYEVDGKRTGSGTVAYFYAIAKIDEAFETKVIIKAFASDKKHKVLTIAEKCRLDGVGGKTPEEVFSVLTGGTGTAVRQVIMYTLNAEGLVNAIDTASLNEESRENEYTLWVTAPMAEREFLGDSTSQIYVYKSVGTDWDQLGYPLDKNTILFYTPEADSDITTETMDIFAIGSASSIGLQDIDRVAIYKYNDASPYADIVVMERESASGLSSAGYLINDIYERLSADKSEVVTVMNSLPDTAGATIKEILISDYVNIQFNGGRWLKVAASDVDQYLSPGDIVQLGQALKAESGETIYHYMRLLYDYSEDKPYWATESAPHKYGSLTHEEMDTTRKVRYTFGYIDYMHIEHDLLDRYNVNSIFSVSDYEHNVMDMFALDTSRNRFPIFDESRRGFDKAYNGVVGDIIDYQCGKENATRVFLRWEGDNPRGYIFYK